MNNNNNNNAVPASTQPRVSANDTEPLIIEEKVQIVNGEHIVKKYQRGPLLGKGGFAKCFQVTNLENKKVMAAKIIPKNTLVKNRARQKLISEIKIHKSLHHNNIVKFEHVFEDHDNVYILLELCPHQTLNELIKRRKRITELETLCYTVQIVQALKYLHLNRVIHRDLKLGNLFVGDKMEIKLGDFGLATKLEFDGEKKRTICGTPNYIAPEILDGRIGHSYEVDVWSLGVILYTLLIGKPPFETSDVKTTYKRIKANQYSFPDHAPIPDSAKALIQSILQQEPAKRPTLDEILAHPFINNGGTIPKLLPVSTLHNAPHTSYLKQYAPSATNLKANQQSQQINTEVFSSRNGLAKSQTTTNIMKGADYANNYYPEEKKTVPPTQQNQFMSSVNLQNKNAAISYPPGTDFQSNRGDGRPGTSGPVDSLKQMSSTSGLNKHTSVQQIPGRQDAVNVPQNVNENANQIDGSKNNLWVTQYVDYSTKYGLGYLLSNGSSGVVFNDTTKIILDPKGSYFEYIYKKENDEVAERHNISEFPPDLQKKVTLLQHFRNYLVTEATKKMLSTADNGKERAEQQQLQQQQQTINPNIPLAYLKKWMQTRHAIMFRLSTKIVQVQFSDKTEILLNSQDKIVSFLNKRAERSHYPLTDAMNSTNVDMTKRLKYTKEILTHLLKNSGARNANGTNPNENQPYPIEDNIEKDHKSNNYQNQLAMMKTIENEFPKLNINNPSDPFSQQRALKSIVSQKSITEKDQMQYTSQNPTKGPSNTSQKFLNNFPNQASKTQGGSQDPRGFSKQ